MEVVFSKRAMTSLLVETREKITTETGGVFLGRYESGVWYVVEAIDPGPKSVFEPAYFEYDRDYIDHLINKISRLYREQLDLIGLWHRHPGSMDVFSRTDDGTNTKYANLSEFGAISGLVNIDPEFRLTLYHVRLPLAYEKIKYTVDDERIPESIRELKDPADYAKQLGKIQTAMKMKKNNSFSALFGRGKQKDAISTIHEFLKKRTFSDTVPQEIRGYEGELPIENILEEIEQDLTYFEEHGTDYSVSIGESGLLDLVIRSGKDNMRISFGTDKESRVTFTYNELIYKYQKGLFSEALKE